MLVFRKTGKKYIKLSAPPAWRTYTLDKYSALATTVEYRDHGMNGNRAAIEAARLVGRAPDIPDSSNYPLLLVEPTRK